MYDPLCMYMCVRILERGPLRATTIEAKMSLIVETILFYQKYIKFSMSPTSRRAVGIQKHLLMSEHAVLKELLKQRAKVRLRTKLLYSVCGHLH